MRKSDYTLLATIIKCEIDKGGVFMQTAERIARNFALKAHVTGPIFLQACGLK